MSDNVTKLTAWIPGRFFYIGLAIVLLANGLPFIPAWSTFIHMWRAEVAASMFLGGTLFYLYVKKRPALDFRAYSDELKFIILPILAIILWSSLSAIWAPSWKSAIHHSLIWAEYLIIYLLFRNAIELRTNFRKLLGLCVFALVYFAIPAIVEYCAYLSFGGATTLGVRFAKFGEQVVTILPLVLLFVVRARGRMFAIGVGATVCLWLLVFCSFGRANYLLFGFVIAAMFVALLISQTYRLYLPKFALIVGILVVAPLPLQLFSTLYSESKTPATSRFSNSEGLSKSNDFRKLMYSVGIEMIEAHPILGVGADNFGMQLNGYRATYGAQHPDDTHLANAEDQIPSHAHNEFLQMVIELGAVGGLIILWLFAGVGLIAFRALQQLRRGSLYGFAAVLGLGMFLASSLVSAYSFRVMQNGIVFFFVLAVAVSRTLRPSDRKTTEVAQRSMFTDPRLVFAAGLLACAGLLFYSAVRLTSVILTARANHTRPLAAAVPLYEMAMSLDDENPDVRHNLGMRMFRAGRYEKAIPYLQEAIAIGRAPSGELSYLASAQALAGDNSAAEATLSYAAGLYPQSPFVLTRYSIVLEENGKTSEADACFRRAVAIDKRSADTWRALVTSGPMGVSGLVVRDPGGYFPVMELRPESSVYAVVAERFIRFPEEKRFSFSSPSREEE